MKIIEHNVETGEIIERDATAEEIAQREKDEKEGAVLKAQESKVKAKRQELLDRLGITEEEGKLLLS